MSLYGKFLIGFELLPREIACFRERTHLVRCSRKSSNTRQEFAVEELSKRSVVRRLELRHIDLVLGDKGLDFPSAPPAVLIGGNEPVIGAAGLKPLRQRPAWPAVVCSRVIVHELFDQ